MDNLQIVKEYIEEIENKGNINSTDKFLDPHFQVHSLHQNPQPVGSEQPKTYQEALQQSQKTLSKSRKIIKDIFAQNDKVVVVWTTNAVNTGDFMGNPTTNKNVTYSGISIYRLANGKIIEQWYVWDRLGLYEQLGIMKENINPRG